MTAGRSWKMLHVNDKQGNVNSETDGFSPARLRKFSLQYPVLG